ncbi:DUF3703 domain-containing protein [Marinobacter sp.]
MAHPHRPILSFLQWVPVENTGRANVSAFTPMPLPEDLARVLNEVNRQ